MFKMVHFILGLNPHEIPIRLNLVFAPKQRLIAECVRTLQTLRVLPASVLGIVFDHCSTLKSLNFTNAYIIKGMQQLTAL